MDKPTEPRIGTAFGGSINPFKFNAKEEFDYKVVARSLSNICRFTGHYGFISVAEHSVLVRWIMVNRYWSYPNGPFDRGGDSVQSTVWGLVGLLHDASESIIGDISSPVKGHPDFDNLRKMEDGYIKDILEIHGIKPTKYLWEELHRADKYALAVEVVALGQADNPVWADYLNKWRPDHWRNQYNIGPRLHTELWTPEKAERQWLKYYEVDSSYLNLMEYGKK